MGVAAESTESQNRQCFHDVSPRPAFMFESSRPLFRRPGTIGVCQKWPQQNLPISVSIEYAEIDLDVQEREVFGARPAVCPQAPQNLDAFCPRPSRQDRQLWLC